MGRIFVIAKRVGDNLGDRVPVCGASDCFCGCEVHGEFGVKDESYIFEVQYLGNEVETRV